MGVGAVYVAGRRCRDAGTRLAVGQVVTAVLEEGGRARSRRRRPPARSPDSARGRGAARGGQAGGDDGAAHGGAGGDSLVDVVGEHLKRPAGLVHRLDRETSGVTVCWKTPQATTALAEEFREGRARKRYVAAVGPVALPPGNH